MKLHLKKIVLLTALFSSTAFAYLNITYRCYSPTGSILFGGNAPFTEIGPIIELCERNLGGTLVLGQKNDDPIN